MVEIVAATRNAGKLRELHQLVADLPVVVLSAEDVNLPDVDETGATFEENAVKKAVNAARITGRISLGEDSGLEVDALGGKPGVYSSRFAGPKATDEDRNRLILEQLAGVPWEKRTARYRAVVAVATPDGRVEISHGVCEGIIAEQPDGTNGFGYDPIFFYPPFGCTFGRATPDMKNSVSHRGQALRGILPALRRLIQSAKER